MFTLHRHARSRIGLALDGREVTFLQRILRCVASHTLDGNGDFRPLKAAQHRSERIAASMDGAAGRVCRHRSPNHDAFLKHFLR
ncbi:hypothetical protein [Burkholderia metallica]